MPGHLICRTRGWNLLLPLLSLSACQGTASFGAICQSLDMHERYAVREFLLPSGPQDLVADIDGDGVAENQFGVFSQSSSASMFFDLATQISTGLQNGLGVLLVDLQSSSREPECQAVSLNLAMPSRPPKFDGSDSFPTLLGQPWLAFPVHSEGDAIVSDELASDLSPDPARLDLFLPVSGTPIHFGVYAPRIRLRRTGPATIEGQIHGALKSALIDNALSTIAAQNISQFINDNSNNGVIVQGIVNAFEHQSNSSTIEKCKNPQLCCISNPATCVILPDEFRQSGFLTQNLPPDVQTFSNGMWMPVPGGTDKNGTSFGIGFKAVAAEHQTSCPADHFCQDSRIRDLIPPEAKLLSISGSAYNDVWVSGESGILLHFDGLQWSRQRSIPFNGNLFPLDSRTSDDVAIAELDTDKLARWNGISWVIQPKAPTGITRLHILDQSTIVTTTYVVSGASGAVSQMKDDYWKVVHQAQGHMINITSIDNTIWATGLIGRLLTNTGGQWHEEAIPGSPTQPVDSIWGNNRNDIWVVGRAFCVHWNGASWETKLDCNRPGNHNGVWGYRDDQVWITSDGYIQYLARRTAQPTWRQIPLEPAISPESIWGSGQSEVWVVGAGASLLRYQP